ncbi:hypothetical protein [Streptomyces sp. NPDC001815]|uniref:hypothetical protein n=1 Tax=Streptomyces sp. NPDC001815 TaxID=3154526 RepID=UPI00332C0862
MLISLAALLAPLSVIAVWSSDIVGDTDRYVSTVAPLASDPDIQASVTTRVTNAVMDHVDVPLLLEQVTPEDRPRLEAAMGRLEEPLMSGLRGLVESVTARFVSSDGFATLWSELNRGAHQAVNKALTGSGGGAVQLEGDNVTVDLAPVVERVKALLVDNGLSVADKIPELHTDLTVATSEEIGKVQTGFRLLQLMGGWLPLVTVLMAAAGVLLAFRRRRALITAALAVVVTVGLLGVGLSVFRVFYLDALPASVNSAAAGSIYDTLVRFLRGTVRAVVTLGVLTAVAAWLTGHSRWALSVRAGWRSALGAARAATGLSPGPVGVLVHRLRTWLNWGVVALAVLTIVLWDRPTAMVTLCLALTVLALLAVLEFLDPAAQHTGHRHTKPVDSPSGRGPA